MSEWPQIDRRLSVRRASFCYRFYISGSGSGVGSGGRGDYCDGTTLFVRGPSAEDK